MPLRYQSSSSFARPIAPRSVDHTSAVNYKQPHPISPPATQLSTPTPSDAKTLSDSQTPTTESPGARFRRVSNLAYNRTVLRENRSLEVKPTRWLVVVLPPSALNVEPVLGNTLATAPPGRFTSGILMPLFPTLYGQLSAIAKEFALPSTSGVCIYLHVAEAGQTMSPRISDESWQLLWSHYFVPDDHAPVYPPHRLPISGQIEFDIDVRKARWYSSWVGHSRHNSAEYTPSIQPSHWRAESHVSLPHDIAPEESDILDDHPVYPPSRTTTTARYVPRPLALVGKREGSVRSGPKAGDVEPVVGSRSHVAHQLSPVAQVDEPQSAKHHLDTLVRNWRAGSTPMASGMPQGEIPNSVPDTMDFELDLNEYQWSVSSRGPPEQWPTSPIWDDPVPSVHIAGRMRGSVILTPSVATTFGPIDCPEPPISNISRLPSPDLAARFIDDSPPTPTTATSWGPPLSWPASPVSEHRVLTPDIGQRGHWVAPLTPTTATSWGAPSEWPPSPIYSSRAHTPDIGHRGQWGIPASLSPRDSEHVGRSPLRPNLALSVPPPWYIGARPRSASPSRNALAKEVLRYAHVWPRNVRNNGMFSRNIRKDNEVLSTYLHVWPRNTRRKDGMVSSSYRHVWPRNNRSKVSSHYLHVWPRNTRRKDGMVSSSYRHVWPRNIRSKVSSHYLHVWPRNIRREKPSFPRYDHIWPRNIRQDGHTVPRYIHVWPRNARKDVLSIPPAWYVGVGTRNVQRARSPVGKKEASSLSRYIHVWPRNTISRKPLTLSADSTATPASALYPASLGSRGRSNNRPTHQKDAIAASPIHRLGQSVTLKRHYPALDLYRPVYPNLEIYPEIPALNNLKSQPICLHPSGWHYPDLVVYPAIQRQPRSEEHISSVHRPRAYPNIEPYTSQYPSRTHPHPGIRIDVDTPKIKIIGGLAGTFNYPTLEVYPPTHEEADEVEDLSSVAQYATSRTRFYPFNDIYTPQYPYTSLYSPIREIGAPKTRSPRLPGSSLDYPNIEIYPPVYPSKLSNADFVHSSRPKAQYPNFDLYSAVYPYFDLYPSVNLPNEATERKSLSAKLPRHNPSLDLYSPKYPNFDIYPRRQSPVFETVVYDYPNIVIYPTREGHGESTSLVHAPRNALTVKLPKCYPQLGLYSAKYPQFEIYPRVQRSPAIEMAVYEYPNIVIYPPTTGSEESQWPSPARLPELYTTQHFSVYPIAKKAEFQVDRSPIIVRLPSIYPLLDIYPAVYPYIQPYPAATSVKVSGKSLNIQLPGAEYTYPNLAIYPEDCSTSHGQVNSRPGSSLTIFARSSQSLVGLIDIYTPVYPHFDIYPKVTRPQHAMSSRVPALYPCLEIYTPVYPYFSLYPAVRSLASATDPLLSEISRSEASTGLTSVPEPRKIPRKTHLMLHVEVFPPSQSALLPGSTVKETHVDLPVAVLPEHTTAPAKIERKVSLRQTPSRPTGATSSMRSDIPPPPASVLSRVRSLKGAKVDEVPPLPDRPTRVAARPRGNSILVSDRTRLFKADSATDSTRIEEGVKLARRVSKLDRSKFPFS